jgi:hypothetical protein
MFLGLESRDHIEIRFKNIESSLHVSLSQQSVPTTKYMY